MSQGAMDVRPAQSHGARDAARGTPRARAPQSVNELAEIPVQTRGRTSYGAATRARFFDASSFTGGAPPTRSAPRPPEIESRPRRLTPLKRGPNGRPAPAMEFRARVSTGAGIATSRT